MSAQLDLRGVGCPMNLVRVKLALEDLGPGDRLEVVLDPGEGLENVPRSVRAAGHEATVDADARPPRIVIRKGDP